MWSFLVSLFETLQLGELIIQVLMTGMRNILDMV
jgi:hypothetical protein